MSMTYKSLWRCPKCERKFSNHNQAHSCRASAVAVFLKGKSPHAKALFKKFVSLVKKCGPVIVNPVKTRVSFQARMNYAAVDRLNNSTLYAHIVLARRLKNKRFTKIESVSPKNHIHYFEIHGLGELDNEVLAWLKEAYKVDKQEHLKKY